MTFLGGKAMAKFKPYDYRQRDLLTIIKINLLMAPLPKDFGF
jgi:hypothetical protein